MGLLLKRESKRQWKSSLSQGKKKVPGTAVDKECLAINLLKESTHHLGFP